MEEKIDFLDKTPTSDTIQDFLYKLDMKPHMHIGSFLLHSRYRKVASSIPVYYSIFNQFWGATN